MDENLALGLFLVSPVVCAGGLVFLRRRLRARPGPTGWPMLLLGNALVLLCLLSAGTLAGEIFFRFIYDTTDSLGNTKVCERWAQRYFQANRAGCRDNIEYSSPLKPGVRRFSFLGDSFTTGHGVKNVEDRFANRFRRAHPQWEVHALAQPGFETGDETAFLSLCLQNRYQLDQVVLVYCLNDISDLVPEWTTARDKIYAEQDGQNWLVNSSYFCNFIYHRWKAVRNPWIKNYFQFVRQTATGPVWEQQKERLKALKQEVESNGGHLVVVTFPFLHAVGPDYEFQPLHDSLNQFWREQKVPHLDLLPIYKNTPARKLTVNSFDAHPNEYAHALAADAIGKFLQEQLAVSPK
ncbi:MAG: SGNH/GDSL hydrolase family protein [Pedosphaera sp.]|nr:SGNH/GDSL hydrolase family protein [Pedosphaera sp.]